MKSFLHSKSNTNNPNYAIISMALVQSEIYWICSVLYYVFQSGLATQQLLVHGAPAKKQRSRPQSQSVPASPPNYILEFGDFVQFNEEQENALRRLSLPMPSTGEGSIRQRPSVHDEQKGTTCPPIWWQKTRVKLGRAPVHGDTKIIADSPKQIESPTNAPSSSLIHFKEPTVPAIVKRNNTTPISVTPTVNSPLLTPRSNTSPLSPSPSIANNSLSPPSIYTINEEEVSLSRQASENSAPATSEHQQQQRVKKFMSKLNTALKSIPHHHRRNNSSDSKKSSKK